MLNYRTSVPPHIPYATVHLKSSLIEGDWVELEYHSGAPAGSTRESGPGPGSKSLPLDGFRLPRPFRNPLTGVTLRSSRADVEAFHIRFGPFISECARQFVQGLDPDFTPPSMPLFVSAGWPINTEDWVDFIQTALPPMPWPVPVAGLPPIQAPVLLPFALPHPVELICARRGRTAAAEVPPLELPLRIACEPELSAALFDAASYLRVQDVQRHVLRIEPTYNLKSLPDADILVLSENARRAGLRLSHKQINTLFRRTRLIIVLDSTPGSPFKLPERLPNDVAVAVVPLSQREIASDALHYFLEEIVHDNPLHDAMRLMRERLQGTYTDPPVGQREWTSLARVYADATSNESLRLSAVVPKVADRATQVLTGSYTGKFADLAARLSRDLAPDTVKEFGDAFAHLSAASEPFRAAVREQINFDRESLGLVPLAAIAGTSARMQERLARVTPQLAALVSKKGVLEALEKHQERRVDAQLFYRLPDNLVQPVSKQYALAPEQPLRLRVHIGPRSEDSILVMEPPAIDPMMPPLPQEELHELQITVFPKDFSLDSDATQTVRLSRLGGTAPVEWDLRAPLILKEPPRGFDLANPLDASRGLGWIMGSQASLRLNVYYGNQLLQSFNLTALVGNAVSSDGMAIRMECDYSQTKRFGQLGDLGSRAISLALNADNETHTLMLAKDGHSASIRWGVGQLANFTEAVRQQLFDAMAEKGVPRFAFDPQTLALLAQSLPNFETGVRALAKVGSRLHAKLFQRSALDPKLKQALLDIQVKDADVVQITATDPDYAFPWPILYDYDPPANAAAAAAPICSGALPSGAPCGCHSDAKGYCLRGFWGLRLVVEQRAPGPEPLYTVPSRIAPSATEPVIGLVAAVSDQFIDQWAKTLEAATKLTVKTFSNTEKLLHTFRNEASRPSVIIFAGHHRNDGDNKLPDHQLLSPADDPILTLADFKKSQSWDLPRSLVFLLACSAGTARADTGPSLATALLNHGAAGVIATECTVYTPMVARISRDILAALAANNGSAKTTIGQAMQQTLLALAREGCPLGLAFTYHGIAEASLP